MIWPDLLVLGLIALLLWASSRLPKFGARLGAAMELRAKAQPPPTRADWLLLWVAIAGVLLCAISAMLAFRF